MPTPRSFPGTGVVNGMIYTIGGIHFGEPWNKVEAYNPATKTWEKKPAMPTGRASFGSRVVDGIIYCTGGWANGTQLQAYDPATDTWSVKAPLPTPRCYLGMTI